MTQNIKWYKNQNKAIKVSRENRKPVLLDFFNPDSIGCRQMDNLTYSNEKAIEALENHVVPLRVPHNIKPLSEEYCVRWTPAIFIIDPDGKVHTGNIGFLPPAEFIPWIIMGRGKMYFDLDEIDNALILIDSIFEIWPDSDAAPQAMFYKSICQYKKSNDVEELRKGYEDLRDNYPESTWTKKALPYRLL